jgi:hypothetical protein
MDPKHRKLWHKSGQAQSVGTLMFVSKNWIAVFETVYWLVSLECGPKRVGSLKDLCILTISSDVTDSRGVTTDGHVEAVKAVLEKGVVLSAVHEGLAG